MKCLRCELENPSGAAVCECGFSLDASPPVVESGAGDWYELRAIGILRPVLLIVALHVLVGFVILIIGASLSLLFGQWEPLLAAAGGTLVYAVVGAMVTALACLGYNFFAARTGGILIRLVRAPRR